MAAFIGGSSGPSQFDFTASSVRAVVIFWNEITTCMCTVCIVSVTVIFLSFPVSKGTKAV